MSEEGDAPEAGALEIEDILDRLRCPKTGTALRRDGDFLRSAGGASGDAASYPIVDGVPDLRTPPERLTVDLPWYEPWADLETLSLEPPPAHSAPDLPYHLDAQLASVPGDEGDGRWILEVGCGQRQCEAYFARRGFNYVGTDVDHRGRGPHLLSDAHNLPFDSGSFDLYTSMAVYEHLVSPLQAALEAHRILRPGGVFFGTAAFVYGFHDLASFHHMTHGGLLWTFHMAGFEVERIWPDWLYTESIPEMAFGEGPGTPWRMTASALLRVLDWTFVTASRAMRPLAGKPPLDLAARRAERAGSLSFIARKRVD
ncbi:MAG: class I SAM-dependent methyltransferase [bacterium]|nr:class I SAM-dependent methyltransferase [bacterium]